MEHDVTLLPLSPKLQKRAALQEAAIIDDASRYVYKKEDEVFINEGQRLDAFYQLLEGAVEVIRHFDTSKEERELYLRTEIEHTTPILGASYFFLEKGCTRRYLAVTDCVLVPITIETLQRVYKKRTAKDQRDLLELVREMARNSDMPKSFFREELDRRFDTLGYNGFRWETPETLLAVDDEHVDGDVSTISYARELLHRAYVDYSCEMLHRLAGDRIMNVSRVGEETNIAFRAPPVLR